MSKDKIQAAARTLTAHGYGLSAEGMAEALTAVGDALPDMLYAFARLAEKRGDNPFYTAWEEVRS